MLPFNSYKYFDSSHHLVAFQQPFINHLNLFNQVGIRALNIIGTEADQFTIDNTSPNDTILHGLINSNKLQKIGVDLKWELELDKHSLELLKQLEMDKKNAILCMFILKGK